MSRLFHHLLAWAAALLVAAATARSAVEISDVHVTNIGTTTFTVVWVTSEVSTPALEIFTDSGGANSVQAGLGLDYYAAAEGDPGVVNSAAGRASRRDLELLAINRRVVSVRVTGLSPGTTYYLRPRTFDNAGVDNGTGLLPVRAATSALFTSMITDARLLQVRFTGISSEGMIAVVQGPAGTAPLSAIVGDSAAADTAVVSLAGLLDTASGTNALFNSPQQLVVRLLGAGAPTGSFTHTVNFGTAFTAARLEVLEAGGASPAPVFTAHPVAASVPAGATAAFSAAAAGTPVPALKWQRQPVGGGTWSDLVESATYVGVATANLEVRSVTPAMTGDQFRCVAANGVPPDAISNVALLTVTSAPTAPTIATQPVDTGVNAGGNATLSVVASGVPAPAYQWKKGDAEIAGATSASLVLNNVGVDAAGAYRVVVSNSQGSVTSAAATLTVYVAPVITSQPAPRTVTAGESATFVVGATGTPAPRYQWKANGANIPGATTATLVLSNLTVADSTSLTVEVSNAAAGGLGGTVTSQAAALVVNIAAPIFLSTPGSVATAVQGLGFRYGPVTINPTPATFSATGLPPGLSVNAASGTIDGVPLVVGALPASFAVTLVVENSAGSATQAITLTVNPQPPLISSPLAAGGQVGVPFSYAIVASNSPTGYGAGGLPGGLNLDAGTGVISGTPTQGGQFTVTISVTNAGGTTSRQLTLSIQAPAAPAFLGVADAGGTQGVAFSYTPAFSGSPTSHEIRGGSLPAGLSLNPTTGLISGTPTQVGDFDITIRATNAGGSTDAAIRITINPAPAAPVIISANAVATTVGASFSFNLTASGVPAVYTFVANNRPAWLNLDAGTGLLSGIPTLGTYELTVYATNSPGPGVTMQGPESLLTITVNPSPNAPVINSAAVVPGRVGQPINFTLTSQPAANTFAVTSPSPPAWLSLNATSGAISGTPTASGEFRVRFAASSATFGQGPELEVRFDIAPALQAPVITSSGTARGEVGQPFRYVITASNGPITSYSVPLAALPAGLAFNASSGIIEGIPSAATRAGEPALLAMTATNDAGTSEPKVLALTIEPPPAAPVITSPLDANGRVGTAFAYQITASGDPTSFVSGDLPSGLTLNPATGLINGSPTTAGRYSVALRAGNTVGLGMAATLELTLVSAPGAPRITSLPAAAGQVGAPFSYSIVAEPGPILSYGRTGTLPPGLTMNTATGVISGRPSRTGLFIIRVTATNGTGTSLPQPLVIGIKPGSGVPLITSPRYDLATVGEHFSYTITASNLPESRPLAPPNSLDATNLPPGLAVNPAMGVISGTPTTVGAYLVGLVGTNASGSGAARDVMIIVRPSASAPVITSPSTAAAQAGTGFAYTIRATNNPTSFEVVDAPTWMTVNTASGVISGTPTAPGDISLALLARNAAGASDPLRLAIRIAPAAGTPVITSSRTAVGTKGTTFSYTITADPAATSFIATGLPAGLAVNTATGQITGIPTASGSFTVILTAGNANGQGASAELRLEILSPVRLAPGP